MLTLLKPWRDIRTDLKSETETWSDALQAFLADAPPKTRALISGIQYFYECDTAAREKRSANTNKEGNALDFRTQPDEEVWFEEDINDTNTYTFNEDLHIGEDDLANIAATLTPHREEMHGQLAIELARRAQIFPPAIEGEWDVPNENRACNATGGDLRKLEEWKAQMRQDVAIQNEEETEEMENDYTRGVEALDLTNISSADQNVDASVSMLAPEEPLTSIAPDKLNEEQLRAYNIIVDHLQETLAGRNPPPLKMIIYGEGGTGKSKVIQTMTDAFIQAGTY